jgi:hypothetical protein
MMRLLLLCPRKRQHAGARLLNCFNMVFFL